MALKDQVVELVLRARNLLSGDTDRAAQSVEGLSGSAEELQQRLRDLEDQKSLISQFESASKAVDRTASAYDRAQIRLDKLKSKLDDTGPLTEAQQREFTAASRAVERASLAYEDAQSTLGQLSSEAEKAEVDVTNLSAAKRENAQQVTAAKRAIEDYNEEVGQGEGKLKSLGQSLLSGAASFAKWASAAAAAGTALAATAITRLTTNQADLARQTLASAEAFGVSAESLQRWQYAAEQVGIGGEKTADILKDVSEKIGDAFATGGGEAAEVIDRLNISIEDLVKLEPDQQILAISEQLTGLPKSEQIQILESLASDASLLLPLLDNNAQKLRELSQVAEQRGDILTEEELQRLAAFDAAFERVKTTVSGFFKTIAVQLAPAFEALASKIDTALNGKPELIDKITGALSRAADATTTWISGLGSMDGVSARFSQVADTVDGLKNLFLAVGNGARFLAAETVELAARFNVTWQQASLAILEFRNKIGLATDEAVVGQRVVVDAAKQAVEDLTEEGERYAQQAKDAGQAAVESFARARDAAEKSRGSNIGVIESLEDIETGYQDVGDASEDLVDRQDKLKRKIEDVATALEQVGDAYENDSSEAAQRSIQALRAEYEALLQRLRELQDVQSGGGGGDEGGGEDPVVTRYENQAEAVEKVGDAADKAKPYFGSLQEGVIEAGDSIDETGDKAEDAGRQAEASAGSVGAAIGAIFNNWTNRLSALSDAAAAAFQSAIGGTAVTATSALERSLEGVNNLLAFTADRVRTNPISKMLGDWAEAGFKTEKAFYEQSIAVEELTRQIAAGDRSMSALSWSAEDVRRRFDMLDDQQLSGLIGAIQSARREAEALAESVQDSLNAARQELAALEGDTAEVERLRYAERRLELEQQLQQAEFFGDKESIDNIRELMRLNEQAHQLKMKRAAAADRRQRQADADAAAAEAERIARAEREERQDISRSYSNERESNAGRSSVSSRTVDVNIVVNGQRYGAIERLEEDQADDLIRILEQLNLTTPG